MPFTVLICYTLILIPISVATDKYRHITLPAGVYLFSLND